MDAPKYNQSELAALRAALLKLLNGDIISPCHGVCMNVDARTQSHPDGYVFCEFAADTWPHTLRNSMGKPRDYFIPKVLGFSRWEGQNHEMRKDFIRHALGVVAALEAEVHKILTVKNTEVLE